VAKQHGKNTVVYIGGYDLTRHFAQADADQDVDEVEVTTYGASGKEYVLGYPSGMMDLQGYFDTDPTAAHDVLQGILGGAANTPVSLGMAGSALGDYALLLDAKEKDYKIGSSIGGAVSFTISLRADGAIGGARVLHAKAAETATDVETGVDWGAASTSSTGFDANIHVTAISGGITFEPVLKDSADNVTYATFTGSAFAAITAIGAENIGGTASVRRYTRVDWTITGTGSVTFVVTLAKRI
jgi:hypothetical protein